MTTQEKVNYEAHLKNLVISHSMLDTAKMEGVLENGKSIAQKLIIRGFANEDIADITRLSMDLIEQIRKEMN